MTRALGVTTVTTPDSVLTPCQALSRSRSTYCLGRGAAINVCRFFDTPPLEPKEGRFGDCLDQYNAAGVALLTSRARSQKGLAASACCNVPPGTQPPCCEGAQAAHGEAPRPTASANLPGTQVSHLESGSAPWPRGQLWGRLLPGSGLEQQAFSFNPRALLLIPLKSKQVKHLVTCPRSQL